MGDEGLGYARIVRRRLATSGDSIIASSSSAQVANICSSIFREPLSTRRRLDDSKGEKSYCEKFWGLLGYEGEASSDPASKHTGANRAKQSYRYRTRDKRRCDCWTGRVPGRWNWGTKECPDCNGSG